MSIAYQNVRGLRTKLTTLYTNSFNIDQQILVFTETWLNDNFLNTEILCNKFNIFRRDRGNETTGGGVLIAISCNLPSELLVTDTPHDIEFIAVSIKMNGHRIFITCLYIPPSSPQAVYIKHAEAISTVAHSSKDGDFIFVLGDFNLPSIQWKYLPDDGYFIQMKQNSNFDEFFNILYDLGLFQINGIPNINFKILDLIFVNEVTNSFIKRSFPITSPEDCYHPTLVVKTSIPFNLSMPSCSKNEKVFSFKHTNYNMLNELLINTDWHSFFHAILMLMICQKPFTLKLIPF